MAGEQESQAAASAATAVSSPLSSPAPSQSAPAASDTPAAAASDPKPASPVTTTSTEPAAAAGARPEGLSDKWWDKEKNELKVDAAELIKRDQEFDRLTAAVAAEDVRKGSLPANADAYKLELPADFKLPAGVEFKLDTANPALGQLKQVAHKHGLSQDAVNELIGVYAGNEVGSEAAIKSARDAEIAKLGTTAPARVDNVIQWLSGMDSSADKGDAKALAGMLVTARHVEAFERIITRLTTQGSASFSQSHRVAPDDKAIPGFEGMSFEQKRFAQDQRARKG